MTLTDEICGPAECEERAVFVGGMGVVIMPAPHIERSNPNPPVVVAMAPRRSRRPCWHPVAGYISAGQAKAIMQAGLWEHGTAAELADITRTEWVWDGADGWEREEYHGVES